MKKSVFAVLLTFLLALLLCVSAAAEEKVMNIPVVKTGEGFAVCEGVSVESECRLLDEGNTIYIDGIYSDNFYQGFPTFDIFVECYDIKDLRSKSTIYVVDSSGNTVAEQTGAYYIYDGIICQMELIKAVDEYEDYTVKISYSGKYLLDYYEEDIWPDSEVSIVSVDVTSYKNNAFKIGVANVNAGDILTIVYDDGRETSTKIATVAADKTVNIEFGYGVYFSIYNSISITEKNGIEVSYNNVWLADFGIDEVGGAIINTGVYAQEFVEENAEYVWFGLYEKGFGNAAYDESYLNKINVYMFDTTTGTTVGVMNRSSLEFDIDSYGEIYGEITVNSALNWEHEYIVVFKDGHSVRTQKILVTDEVKITSAEFFDLNDKHMSSLTIGLTRFYAYIDSYNIADPSNIKAEIINFENKVVASSVYDSSSEYHIMNVTGSLTAGTYTLKVTYNGKELYTRPVFVEEAEELVNQTAYEAVIYGGKTYIQCAIDKNFSPQLLTYKVRCSDGNEYRFNFHRSLHTIRNDSYFVIVYNGELNLDGAQLFVYSGSKLLVPRNELNMYIHYTDYKYMPFIYLGYGLTNDYIELYLEGFSTVQNAAIVALDDISKKVVTVPSYSAGTGVVRFRKSDLKRVNVLGYYTSDIYFDSDKECVLEINGEYAQEMYISGYDNIFNYVLNDDFSFQKDSTSDRYEVLNLPKSKYAYYKIATSEAALASASYKVIEEGILYNIGSQQGEVSVYAQFKTAAGVESAVQKASIFVDTMAPEFEISSIDTKVRLQNGAIIIPVEFTTNEGGFIYARLYDADGKALGYETGTWIVAEQTKCLFEFWEYDYDFTGAAKIAIWLEDEAGNKTEESEFSITLVNDPVYAEFENGYIRIICDEEVYDTKVFAACFKDDKLTSFQMWEKDIIYNSEFLFDNYYETADKVRIMIWDEELSKVCSMCEVDIEYH